MLTKRTSQPKLPSQLTPTRLTRNNTPNKGNQKSLRKLLRQLRRLAKKYSSIFQRKDKRVEGLLNLQKSYPYRGRILLFSTSNFYLSHPALLSRHIKRLCHIGYLPEIRVLGL